MSDMLENVHEAARSVQFPPATADQRPGTTRSGRTINRRDMVLMRRMHEGGEDKVSFFFFFLFFFFFFLFLLFFSFKHDSQGQNFNHAPLFGGSHPDLTEDRQSRH